MYFLAPGMTAYIVVIVVGTTVMDKLFGRTAFTEIEKLFVCVKGNKIQCIHWLAPSSVVHCRHVICAMDVLYIVLCTFTCKLCIHVEVRWNNIFKAIAMVTFPRS